MIIKDPLYFAQKKSNELHYNSRSKYLLAKWALADLIPRKTITDLYFKLRVISLILLKDKHAPTSRQSRCAH